MNGRRRAAIAITTTGVAAWLGVGACAVEGFRCQADAQCGRQGACQPTGYCSFADAGCDSGMRYAEDAAGLAGECVPVDANDGTDAGERPRGTDAHHDDGPGRSATSSADGSTAADTASTSDTGDASSTDDDQAPDSSESGPQEPPAEGPPIVEDLLTWLSFSSQAALGADASGHGNDALCAVGTCPIATSDPVAGDVACFDGAGHVMTLPTPATTGGAAFAAVVQFQVPESLDSQALLTQTGSAGAEPWRLATGDQNGDGTPDVLFELAGAGFDPLVASVVAPARSWVTVTAQSNGQTHQLWLDDTLAVSGLFGTVEASDGAVEIGARPAPLGPAEYLATCLDSVAIYQRMLEPEEIAVLSAP